ncbi:Flagellin FlgL [Cohaesibacter sp. ES.047]|uniref:flagellin N-terminal helical domain-containing protein n=1 Tax=Cohaesibacter sp. ES.047 TaxID=1798205 RepID=UPI000BB8460D|nr:flagellin [Cohaesibacter sp. ES.047]SNY94279.1 Flagellin FlgL [Cohaesibacter sp. ES.047]
MSSDITLSAGVRQNLLSLQNTADLMSLTQNRLATGKKVNSALDNPTNFFTSETLSSRANDLSNLLDGISNSIKTLEAADNGISAITDLVESAQSTVRQAQAANNETDGTHIQGARSIDTGSATVGDTIKETVENQTLTNLGFDLATSNIEIISTSTNGVTSEFDLLDHFASTGESLADGDGSASASTDDYTVKDLVEDINASGVATASITADGRLDLQVNGNSTLQLRISDADATDATSQNGTVGTSIAESFGFGTSADVLGKLNDGSTGTLGDSGGTDVTWTDGATAGDVDILNIVNQATNTDADNNELVDQYNEILDQIDELARDASYNGINLINGLGEDLTVAFNEHRDEKKSELQIKSADLTATGLSLTDANTLSDEEANLKLDALADALVTLRSQASAFGSNLSTVQIRDDYTTKMINTLQTGADNLVLADSNEEGANMLALQTRQQLSTTALSLASQADQAVTQFLRA